jgi:hypothetical protein
MNIFGVILNVLGIGGDFLKNKAKLKELKQVQEHTIMEAETKAIVDRIMSNTDSDNQIDMITARNKQFTSKDEVITYLFLIPVFVASMVPFIMAFKSGDWISMNQYVKESYMSLDQLPEWYKYVLAAVVIDVLGFRSFARNLIDKWQNKKTTPFNTKAEANDK